MSVWPIVFVVLLPIILPLTSAYVLNPGSTEIMQRENEALTPTSFNNDWSMTSTEQSGSEADSFLSESLTAEPLPFRSSETSRTMTLMTSEVEMKENANEAEEEWEKDEKEKEKKDLLLSDGQEASTQDFVVESSEDSTLRNESQNALRLPQIHSAKTHSLKSLSLVLINAPTASSTSTSTTHLQRVSTTTKSTLKNSMYTDNNMNNHMKTEQHKHHKSIGNNDVFTHSSHSSNSISYDSNSAALEDLSLLMNETVRVTKAPDSILNLTGELGGSVFLPCAAHHSMETQVSWVRRRDWHILTSGVLAYTKEERFSVHHPKGSTDWTLVIKYVKERDAGVYECQVSTAHGLLSRLVVLEVVVPKAVIPGSGEYHIGLGSTITLDCYIRQSLVEPQFIFWYHNTRMINYDRERGGINVHIDTGSEVRSRLTIARATPADSGNYTCAATNTQPASANVYILDGDKIAAILPRTYSKATDLRGSVSIVLVSIIFQIARHL